MKQKRSLIHRGSRKRVVIQKAPQQVREVAQFPITNEQLTNIQRTVVKPRDCVVNAMEIIGIADSRSADIMRIMVGDVGVQAEQIEDIFQFLFKRPFVFTYDSDINKLSNYVAENLKINHVIFLGVHYINGDKHVFLIGKDMNGGIIYIDPQNPLLCDLRYQECSLNVFSQVTGFNILEYDIISTIQVSEPGWTAMADDE
jgi:hypothetical protein